MNKLDEIFHINSKKVKLKESNNHIVTSLENFLYENSDNEDHFITTNLNTFNDIEKITSRLDNCSSNIVLQNHEDKKRVLEQNCCNINCLCHVCASKKRNIIISEIMPYIEVIKDIPSLYTYMVTFTIKNVEDPSFGYKALRNSFTRWRKKRPATKKRKNGCGRIIQNCCRYF